MKPSHVEEIIALLSLIVAIGFWSIDWKALSIVFFIKAMLDALCVIREVLKARN